VFVIYINYLEENVSGLWTIQRLVELRTVRYVTHQVKVQQVYFESQAFGASHVPQVSEVNLTQKKIYSHR